MKYGDALKKINAGKLMCRGGWNRAGMYVLLVKTWTPLHAVSRPDEVLRMAPFIALKTADRELVPWAPSQTDMLADDWQET